MNAKPPIVLNDAPVTDAPLAEAGPAKVWKMPAWLVIAALCLFLAGGVWFVWEQLKPAPTPDASAFAKAELPQPVQRGNRGNRGGWGGNNNPNRGGNLDQGNRPNFSQAVDTVAALPNNLYVARIADATARITKDRAGKWNINATYADESFLPEDVRAALQARAVIAGAAPRNAPTTRPANLSADQLDKILRITRPPGMVLDNASRDRLTGAFAAYAAAAPEARAEPEKAFIAVLKEVATAAKTGTVALQTKRAEEVRSVLSADQLETLKKPL